MSEDNMLLLPQPMSDFVETEYVKDITHRALSYIKAGYAIHFRGPAGTGKTTIAKHVAACLERPMVWIHGDDELTTSSLIGGEQGYRSRKIIDNYISSVIKKEEDFVKRWVDNRLTIACRNGFTMLYDEFTRSRPEANNILLSILEDRILNLPKAHHHDDPYMPVHPNFTAIFTSNPEEYAGVHKSQDALLDRMVTIDLDYCDYETELSIIEQKAEIEKTEARLIISLVREIRDSEDIMYLPTIRGSLMIAKIMKTMDIQLPENTELFINICQDILGSEARRTSRPEYHKQIEKIVRKTIDYQLASASDD